MAKKRKHVHSKYIPTYTDKIKAYKVYKKGFKSQAHYAQAVGISPKCFAGVKDEFYSFFERKEKAEEKIRLKRPPGRPKGVKILDNIPLVNEDSLRMLGICGYSVRKAATLIGVAHNTLRDYLKEHPILSDAFFNGAELADAEVMIALKQRACGMQQRKVKFASFEGEITDQREYYEDLAPDTAAASMWLINRKRWTRDSEGVKADNKGKILEALDKMSELSEEDMDKFDKENADRSE